MTQPLDTNVLVMFSSVVLMAVAVISYIVADRRHQRKIAFEKFLSQIREEGDALAKHIEAQAEAAKKRGNANREISELTFRDVNGVVNTVRIIVDPDFEDFPETLDMNEGHSVSDLMSGHKVIEDGAATAEEFVFTASVANSLRESGVELDEVVVKLLKSSGRMPA